MENQFLHLVHVVHFSFLISTGFEFCLAYAPVSASLGVSLVRTLIHGSHSMIPQAAQAWAPLVSLSI
jgi:hypothetical protein